MYFCLVLYILSSLDKSDNIKSLVFSPNNTQAQNTTNIIITAHLQNIKRKVKQKLVLNTYEYQMI